MALLHFNCIVLHETVPKADWDKVDPEHQGASAFEIFSQTVGHPLDRDKMSSGFRGVVDVIHKGLEQAAPSPAISPASTPPASSAVTIPAACTSTTVASAIPSRCLAHAGLQQ